MKKTQAAKRLMKIISEKLRCVLYEKFTHLFLNKTKGNEEL